MQHDQVRLKSGHVIIRSKHRRRLQKPRETAQVAQVLESSCTDELILANLRRLCSDSIGLSVTTKAQVLDCALSLVRCGELNVELATPQAGNISNKQLALIFPNADMDYLASVAVELNADAKKHGLNNLLRRAHFLAQLREESGPSMEATVESLSYSEKGLKDTFSYFKQHPDEAVADSYTRNVRTHRIVKPANQEDIADHVYANRLGNKDAASGDGWKFRGRGMIQVTGRANYQATTDTYKKLYSDTSVDFVQNPDLMAEFPYSLRSAVCFWVGNGLPTLADRGSEAKDVDRITAIVNKKTKSYKAREQHFKVAYHALS